MPDDGRRPPDFPSLLAEARAGSADALGRLLMHYQDYLLLVANHGLERDLHSKVSPSDLVQETFLEAQRDLGRFHGQRGDELLAWLRRILANNLANVGRSYRGTEMRALGREVPLGTGLGQPGGVLDLPQDTPAPLDRVTARERGAALEAALAALPEHYRRVLRLRHWEHRTFAEIGAALGCSTEAARKVFVRAVDHLQKNLRLPDES